jgi:hypothetical protein
MSNPRPITPDRDPRLHPNARPERSLAEDLAGIVDEARQMVTDFGMRPYRVFSVVVRWSGGARHRGTPEVVSTEEFLPTPSIDGRLSRELREAGAVERGVVRLTGLSSRYTEDDIDRLCRRIGRDGDEHYIEVVMDERDGVSERRRYVVSAVPFRRPESFDWEAQLTRQDEGRTRQGTPR